MLGVGAVLLPMLEEPKTVSGLWEAYRDQNGVSFDWFILSLDLLFAVGAITFNKGLIARKLA